MPQSITPTELKQRLDAGENLRVIDVRMPWELEVSHVDFAENIVMDEIPTRLHEIPRDQPLVLMCRSGSRSYQVAAFLENQGWSSQQLYNLEGGILAWAREVDPSLPKNY